MKEHAKCTYSPLRKAFETQTQKIEKHGDKQTEVIKDQGKNKSKL